AFSSFTGNPNTLPVDQHETVAMIAPRGLFIMENPHIDWLAARSGSVAALGGAEVYKALGAGANISYWSDVQDGTHCATRSEWRTPLQQNIQKFLLRTGNTAGVFRISGSKSGNLADWRDWTTPTLTSGAPADPPPADPPPVTGGCTVTASVNQWTGGFVTTVRVTAGAAAVTGWTVTAALPPDTTITSGWNANRSADTGTVQFTNVGFNGAVAPGQSVEFGYQGTGTGSGATQTCSVA
ncbi:cellulose binding domain-containing protein, partial [Actinophytocola sp.]|uniref:cellulose binding domain-containing protein n=1 Tax=Actinophytocola sp. TaxID=1872138 RepID=UPI00389A9288